MAEQQQPLPSPPPEDLLRRTRRLIFISAAIVILGGEVYHLIWGYHTLVGALLFLFLSLALIYLLLWLLSVWYNRWYEHLSSQLELSRQFSDQQSTLVELSSRLAASLDPLDICQTVVHFLHERLRYDGVSIFLISQESGAHFLQARAGIDFPPASPSRPGGMGSGEKALQEEHLRYIPDVSINHGPGDGFPGSEVDLPLHAGGIILGVLVVKKRLKNAFDENDLQILTAAGNQTALALRNAILIQAEKHHAREKEALQKATAALLSTLDLEKLLETILKAARQAIPSGDTGSIYLVVTPGSNQLEMKACDGFTDPRVLGLSFSAERGYSAKAIHLRKPLLIKDVRADKGIVYNGEIEEVAAIQSAIVAPLLLKDQAVGVLSIDSFRRGAFQRKDLQLLVAFANTAAAAIWNARLHQQIQKQAIQDDLTGLYNRRHFFTLVQRELTRSKRYRRQLAVLMLDLDHFKKINDRFGHATGDQVLQEIARRCRLDIRDSDILGRYGGEEFCLVLPETSPRAAYEIAERIRQSISRAPIATIAGEVTLTISIGIACLNPEVKDIHTLLDLADEALYAAKDAGRDCIRIAQASLPDQNQNQHGGPNHLGDQKG